MGDAPGHWNAERNFILQQGFEEPAAQSCELQYSALLIQPRVILAIVVIATILQSPPVFLVLSAILWWSAILPRWNPFEAVYNATLGARPGALRLERAPAPRRCAQAMAATLALAIGVSLLRGWKTWALVVEGFFIVLVVALAFGGFCLGSFVYHLLRGRTLFALRTLPWSRART